MLTAREPSADTAIPHGFDYLSAGGSVMFLSVGWSQLLILSVRALGAAGGLRHELDSALLAWLGEAE